MIRLAEKADLADVAGLCLRSKGHWGYDAAFLDACRDELSPQQSDLGPGFVVWQGSTGLEAMAQVSIDGDMAELDALFVAPEAIGKGLGRLLFNWAGAFAAGQGARVMRITADPYAAPFYQRMGATMIGEEPSGSIAGRKLPVYEAPVSPQPEM